MVFLLSGDGACRLHTVRYLGGAPHKATPRLGQAWIVRLGAAGRGDT